MRKSERKTAERRRRFDKLMNIKKAVRIRRKRSGLKCTKY